MDSKARWELTPEEKNRYIDVLTEALPALRAKADMSQDELARIVGISRQKYGWIERKNKKMLWSTYLALMFFFDHNQATHNMLRSLSAFPTELIEWINQGNETPS